MLSDEILKKIRRLEITTKRQVDTYMSGQFRSHFKGHGVQFSEHRIYVVGDDVRHIDWKVSARSRDIVIKKFEEERELAVFLVVDVSGSEHFGSKKTLKSDAIAELGGMLAYAAIQTGDRVGALLFAGEVEKIIPPRRGRLHVLRVIRDLLSHQPRTRGTDLVGALEAAGRLMKHSGVIFVISDFMTSGYGTILKRLSRRHDVVAIWMTDEREKTVPPVGKMLMWDPESGEEYYVDTASYGFKNWIKSYQDKTDQEANQALKRGRIELIKVSTREDYAEAVVRFFHYRARRAYRK